jgi:hypothetical protein
MFTVPAGKYYLGDPCYSLQDGTDNWGNVLDASDCFHKPYIKGKKMAVAFGTAFGDGEYFDQHGNAYPVDSGMIGLVPVSMATVKKPTGVQKVEFKSPVECTKEGGLLKFGEYEIDTDPQEEEDDECCGECGRPY